MDRRQFVTSAGAVTALAAFRPVAAFAQAGSGDAALNALFNTIAMEAVQTSPEFATSLGFDKGPLARLKSELSPRTAAERKSDLERTEKAIGALRAVSEANLSPAAKLNREVVIYLLESQATGPKQFDIGSPQRPYLIYQQGGAYFSTPDFLNTAHTINTKDDCTAYLSRLEAFARNLDEESADHRAQAARGIVAPAWAIDLTLGQMAKLRAPEAAASGLAQSVATRAAAKNISGDWGAQAAKIVGDKVYPALDRQIAMMKDLRGKTPTGDGAWRLKDGAAIYAAALEQATTTKFRPEEVHKIGLEEVADLTAKLDVVLKAAGMTRGTVGERLAALNVRPEQLYANTDAARAELIAGLNANYKEHFARLSKVFATIPTQPMEIRRVPPDIQDGASNGYYRSASLDGSRPAIYFINLKDTGDWPKYSLPSLTYHEGVPGHHLQISLAQESKDIPMLRKFGGFSAYSEGWALYSEALSDEIGGYSGLEKAGYLQSFLFRAARLVVDTGLHTKRWSREKAVDYMVATTGFARPRCQREVERYCTMIGQACSYKIGHIAWTRARAASETALGSKFDIKQFHEVLKEGAMPLTILERRIAERTAAAARA